MTGQFEAAYEQAQTEGMKGLIIDLRGNPGGNLSTVCDIARMLLPKGLIVYTEDKYGKREEYTCKGENAIQVSLVVLTDGLSASASEILAGAVKDYQIGTLVGTTTFGKGIVQKVINLSDGSAVKLTVSSYFTPNGNNIHGIGIEPDVEVEFDAELYKNGTPPWPDQGGRRNQHPLPAHPGNQDEQRVPRSEKPYLVAGLSGISGDQKVGANISPEIEGCLSCLPDGSNPGQRNGFSVMLTGGSIWNHSSVHV